MLTLLGGAMHVSDRDIREHLGHGQGNRRVRVQRDGKVHYYGSTVDTDRSHDYWHFAGFRDELAAEVERERAAHTCCPPSTGG